MAGVTDKAVKLRAEKLGLTLVSQSERSKNQSDAAIAWQQGEPEAADIKETLFLEASVADCLLQTDEDGNIQVMNGIHKWEIDQAIPVEVLLTAAKMRLKLAHHETARAI